MRPALTLSTLLRRLLPLSASDMAMALGDPIVAIALVRLGQPEVSLATMGILKSVANFLESPIIMLLQASTALSVSRASMRALGRFTVLAGAGLSLLFLALAMPPLYELGMRVIFAASPEVAQAGWGALVALSLWPGVIAWRRYYQGILIREGRGRSLGLASLARIGVLSVLLYSLGRSWPQGPGALIAALSLMGGLLAESVLVTWWARQGRLSLDEPDADLPVTLAGVARYYMPLATTMVIVWGGRALLVIILARAVDGELALATWAGGWGFIILLANATRMVQQLVIAHADQAPRKLLLQLASTAGLLGSAVLAWLGFSQLGRELMSLLLGNDHLVEPVLRMMRLSVALPLLVAWLNMLQGFCIVARLNRRIQWAALVGTTTALVLAGFLVASGVSGVVAGAVSVPCGALAEISCLVGSVSLNRSTREKSQEVASRG